LANTAAVRITRKTEDGDDITLLVNVENIMAGKARDLNLEPGDYVYVANKQIDRQVSIREQR